MKKGQKVLLLFDKEKADLLTGFKEAAYAIGAIPQPLELPYGKRVESFPSYAIVEAENLGENDALIVLSSGNMIFNLNLHTFCSPFSKPKNVRARSIYVPPFPAESFIRIMSVDFNEYEDYQARLLEVLRGAKEVNVKSPSGTDVSFNVKAFMTVPYKALAPGDHALLHLGEVCSAIVEGSAEGTIIYDTCLSMGKVKGKLKLRVLKGRVIEEEVLNDDGVIREFLELLRKADENAWVVGEFGIGLNPNAQISGCIMEDESVRGTCHIDLGDNTAFGGGNRSNFHGGGVIAQPLIEVDGKRLRLSMGN